MNLQTLGTNISDSNVTSVTAQGLWVLVHGKEYFVPFADYPMLATATVADLFQVELLGNTGLHWSTLDVDIELEALENPDKFPLLYR